eukprot:TRINITY_DN13251_c0_g1_i1.p1 TRINITY_DN13251_c0_g1~~TRINITY_DN13251_c0_g1_i1.p1  ORF type:complete len:218 (+),score=33.31 TRINITY_DN13251_c0_g1_i1:240-893(+)
MAYSKWLTSIVLNNVQKLPQMKMRKELMLTQALIIKLMIKVIIIYPYLIQIILFPLMTIVTIVTLIIKSTALISVIVNVIAIKKKNNVLDEKDQNSNIESNKNNSSISKSKLSLSTSNNAGKKEEQEKGSINFLVNPLKQKIKQMKIQESQELHSSKSLNFRVLTDDEESSLQQKSLSNNLFQSQKLLEEDNFSKLNVIPQQLTIDNINYLNKIKKL